MKVFNVEKVCAKKKKNTGCRKTFTQKLIVHKKVTKKWQVTHIKVQNNLKVLLGRNILQKLLFLFYLPAKNLFYSV